MKLRIKGNSLRLRVSPSEVRRLLESGRVDETVFFGEQDDARLTYALEHSQAVSKMTLSHEAHEIKIVLPTSEAQSWVNGEQIGIYGETGMKHRVELMVEKDWACLDRGEEENVDTFPNPKQGAAC